MAQEFAISQSKLEEAHNTRDHQWLAATFAEARKVIAAGGRVKITQELSGTAIELVALIDNQEGLDHYIKRYGAL